MKDAATVVLLRDAGDGIETFLLRRVSTMAFAPRMHVFPGGRLDVEDFDQCVRLAYPDGTQVDLDAMAVRASCTSEELVALYACAIRETLEEAGIAIADRDDVGCLIVDPGCIPLFDHWVTPEGESRRYDVRFFIARVLDARLTTTEADAARWIAPADAVAAFEAGELAMLPPTERVLRWLSGFDSAAEAISAGAKRDVLPKMPKRFVDAQGVPHWMLVHHRTGDVLVDVVSMPHTRETDGMPMEET